MKRLGCRSLVLLIIASLSVLICFIFRTDPDSTNKKDEKIYATDITISADFRSLTLYLGNSVKFTDIPYTVKPTEYNQGVEIKIYNSVNQEREGASYENNCFIATETGVFYIRFIVKTKYDTTKYDTIKITVTDKPDETYKSVVLLQKARTITMKETLDIANFVNVYGLGMSIITYKCDTVDMDDSVFKPTNVGTYKIEIIINCDNYLIFDIFTVVVNSCEDINIVLYDVTNTKIERETKYNCILSNTVVIFSYIVEGLNNQRITVQVENDKIVSFISSDAPLIILELIDMGETEIIIKIPNNSYTFSFKIIVG